MHGIIDNTLSCLTGLSRSELDEARFTDLEALVAKVKGKLNGVYNLREYVTEQGIKSDVKAREIIEQMQLVIDILNKNKANNTDLFARLVRNWNQDKKLHTMMPPKVLDQENEILKLFGIERKGYSIYDNDRDTLEFKDNKTISIFQHLKDGYEIDGNIQNIEKECNEELEKLKTTEQKRREFYHEKIAPINKIIREATPPGYAWHKRLNKSLYKPNNFRELNDSEKRNCEQKLFALEENFDLVLPQYKVFKKQVDKHKNKLLEHFKQINTNFANKSQYQLTKLRKFADKYRCIEGDDKDNDALLRMGLCGNYINHERIQGFNAIDLQHAVMLVDEKSSFINGPPQLIQGSGRLRCLNSARLSTLFCHSSDKLKFDIELLQKGNYIDAYNKIMEENNKKSPEELGNEILKTIEKLIEDGVSTVIKDNKQEKFKKIDDLAAEVIKQVISSFDVVYNNKNHNAKEAKDYFVKVLNYVTSRVEKELKNKGVVPGDIDIEHNIRGTGFKIKKIENRIKNDIQSKINPITEEIGKNTQDKKENDKNLKINGNIIKKLIIKLYRLTRRLIGCRIQLEKEKIKLEEDGKKLNQDKEKLEKEKNNLNKKQKELETKKLNLETQIKPEKKQTFIGVMEKKSDVEEKEVTPEEREHIIPKQKNSLIQELEKIEQDLQKLEEKNGKNLEKFEELKDDIERYESMKADIEDLIQPSQGESKAAAPNVDKFDQFKSKLINGGEEKTELERIVTELQENVKKFKTIQGNENQIPLNKIKDGLEKLETEKTKLQKIEEEKLELEKNKSELAKVLEYQEGSIDYNHYYDDVVNKVLVYKSIVKNYDVGKVAWIGEIAEEFIKVINNDYYTKLENQHYTKHINSCVKNPIFLELLSNIVMPLYNDGMLLKTLETIYPEADNQSKIGKICALYDNLSRKEKPGLSNVTEVMIYTQKIAKIVGDVIEAYYNNEKCSFLKDVKNNDIPKPSTRLGANSLISTLKSKTNSLVVNAKSEIERLKNKEALKVESNIYECILNPIKRELNNSNPSKRHWVEKDPSKQEKVAFISEQVGTKLKDIKPFTCRAVISPDTKFLNSVQAEFPIEEIPSLLDSTVAQQWPEEKLCTL